MWNKLRALPSTDVQLLSIVLVQLDEEGDETVIHRKKRELWELRKALKKGGGRVIQCALNVFDMLTTIHLCQINSIQTRGKRGMW